MEVFPQERLNRGWAALCFEQDVVCIDSMKRIAARASRIVTSEFVLQSKLLGKPGATQAFAAFIIPPAVEGALPSSPGGAMVDEVFATPQKMSWLSKFRLVMAS
jgi:hypothetical protein